MANMNGIASTKPDFQKIIDGIGNLSYLQYAIFCGVLKSDCDVIETILLPEEYKMLLDFDLESVSNVDQYMLTPVLGSSQIRDYIPQYKEYSNLLLTVEMPVLYLCCLSGNVRVMNSIVKKINLEEGALSEVLYFACTIGNVKIVNVLIANSVKPTSRELLSAVACYQPGNTNADDYLKITQLLLQSGCSANDSTIEDRHCLPLHISAAKTDSRMTQLLLNNGAVLEKCLTGSHTPLIVAVMNRSIENIDLLLRSNSDISKCSCGTTTPLSAAVESGSVEILMVLLEAGAKVNIYDMEAIAPITLAASKTHLLMVWLMLCHSGNVNTVNKFDEGSLVVTLVNRNSYAGVLLLLRFHADVELETTLGTTAIWEAVRQNNRDIVELLLFVNCRLDKCSLEFNIYHPINPTMLALYRRQWNLLKLLLLSGGILVSSKIYNPDFTLNTIFQSNPMVLKYLLNWIQSTKSLKVLCRRVIRNCIGNRIDLKILKLMEYPRMLKEYILLKDILSKDVSTGEYSILA